MDREIKFRAFDENKKIMMYSESDFKMNPPAENHSINLLSRFFSWLQFSSHFRLMQYTGLKDKNGKEIYEGDVVKTGEEFGEVQYDEQQSAFTILFQPHNKKQKSGCANLASTWPSPLKEILGNIYEHPHLLSSNIISNKE